MVDPEGILLIQETKATHQRQRGLLRAVADAVLEEKGRGEVDVTWAVEVLRLRKMGVPPLSLEGFCERENPIVRNG